LTLLPDGDPLEIESIALVLMTLFGLAIAAGMIWILLKGRNKG
jgi:hypothetical protein